MAITEFADRCVTTPPRGLETQISSDLQRLTQSPQHQRNCHSENQARWHFFKAQSSTAANCAAHSRISNEIPTFDAIFLAFGICFPPAVVCTDTEDDTGFFGFAELVTELSMASPTMPKMKSTRMPTLFMAVLPTSTHGCEWVGPLHCRARGQRAAACALLAGIIRKPQRAKSGIRHSNQIAICRLKLNWTRTKEVPHESSCDQSLRRRRAGRRRIRAGFGDPCEQSHECGKRCRSRANCALCPPLSALPGTQLRRLLRLWNRLPRLRTGLAKLALLPVKSGRR